MAYTIPILTQTFRVLDAVAAGTDAASVNKLARTLGITASSCFRILKTLQAERWIAERPGGGWQLDVSLVRLLDGFAPVQQLIAAAREPLAGLAEDVHLACKLSVRQGDNAVTLLRVDSPAAFGVSGRVGASFPLTVGSSGAVLAADLCDEELAELVSRTPGAWERQSPEDFLARAHAARKHKVVLDEGSYAPHVHTASTAVRVDGEIVAALTVLGMPGDITRKSLPAIQKALLEAARQIEHALSPKQGKKS
jgi:IclR family pca regulon transcriptional regulator